MDISAVLHDLAELYEAVAEDGGQRLVTDIVPGLFAYGDREMIQQAVVNLLDNALKFSPPEGVIRLAASVVTNRLEIVVADAGPGIPAAERDRAVERFFRGEHARSTPGSGLGLALVQAVAVLHGGSVALEDNAPGLRAVLRVPAMDPEIYPR